MERYYGVITGYDPDTSAYSTTYAKKTANEFLNKLFKASKVAKSGSSTAINPIKILSNYTYLTNNGDSSQNDIINDFYSGGVYAETRTPEGEVAILADKTTGMYGANIENSDELSVVAVARFSDRLYLVVRPHLPFGDPIDGWVRSICDIRIEHHYPYTVTPEPDENEGEDDEDPPAPEPVTTDHKTVFHLGSNNSNGNAPAVAYEITTTQSKDTLVKLAWCPADAPSSEKELKNHFTQWDICCYGTKIEGIAGARTLAVTNSKSHTADDFGAGGPIGGFIIHKMKNGTYKYGISVFNTDRSPLYTWSDNARPWDEFDSTGETPRNVNHGGIGRLISKKTISEDSEETILKMAVLAPIFCPAANDQADTAKWMPQGLYDYSYFDKTGHIYLKKSDDMADSTPVFFADHGVYLLDGGLGGYQLTDRSLPESYAINTSVIERPVIPVEMPGSEGMWAYFDCKAGLSESGWLNYRDTNDMLFTNGPVINSDGSAHFVNRHSNPITGMVTGGKWTGPKYSKDINSCFFAVFKWTSNQTTPNNWQTFLLGMLFDKRTNAPNESPNNAALFPYRNAIYGSDAWTIDDSRDQFNFSGQGLEQNEWYIMVYYTRQNNDAIVRLYNSSGVQVSEAREPSRTTPSRDVITNAAAVFCGDPIGRYYMDGYPNSTAKTILQGKKKYSPWDTTFPDILLEVSLDVKFFAAGVYDPNNEITDFDSKMTWCPGMTTEGTGINPSEMLNRCVVYLKDRFFT